MDLALLKESDFWAVRVKYSNNSSTWPLCKSDIYKLAACCANKSGGMVGGKLKHRDDGISGMGNAVAGIIAGNPADGGGGDDCGCCAFICGGLVSNC